MKKIIKELKSCKRHQDAADQAAREAKAQLTLLLSDRTQGPVLQAMEDYLLGYGSIAEVQDELDKAIAWERDLWEQ